MDRVVQMTFTPEIEGGIDTFSNNRNRLLVNCSIRWMNERRACHKQAEILGYDDCSKMQDAGLRKPAQHIIQPVGGGGTRPLSPS